MSLSHKQVLRNLSPWQVDVLLSEAIVRVLLCGRQVGKSTILRAILFKEALENPGIEILFIAKTHGQAKEVGWRAMVAGNDPLFDDSMIAKRNNQDLSIELKNGSRIVFSGSENTDALLGRTIDLLLLDEFQSQSPDVWMLLQPMLAARNGRAVIAGTARGYDHLYDMWWAGWKQNEQRTANWRSWKIRTAEGGTPAGSPEAIAIAKASLSAAQYAQEYDASPSANKGAIYIDFDQSLNESRKELDKTKPLFLGMDFNVNPMVAVVGQRHIVDREVDGRTIKVEEMHILDEIVLENSNTSKMADVIRNKYHEWNGRIIVYPDPAGSANKTSAAFKSTDHSILRSAGFTLNFRPKHPAVMDRVNSVNAMFCNANGTRRLFVHSRCKTLIKCLIGQTFDSTGKPDKTNGLDHANDALGYMIEYLYPISGGGFTQSRI